MVGNKGSSAAVLFSTTGMQSASKNQSYEIRI